MVRLNRIYTRTGDAGTAGLVDGSRVSKASLRMAAIGEVDEANAAIGLALAAVGEGELSTRLLRIQNDLFDLGADVATPGEEGGDGALRIIASQVERLEQEIDAMNADLEPLKASFCRAARQRWRRFTSPGRWSAGPSARRSRWLRGKRSTRSFSPISTDCPTICSSPPAMLPRKVAATYCGSRARRAARAKAGMRRSAQSRHILVERLLRNRTGALAQ